MVDKPTVSVITFNKNCINKTRDILRMDKETEVKKKKKHNQNSIICHL